MTNDVLDPLFDVGGRVAIITGGVAGIGLAISEASVHQHPEPAAAAADKQRSADGSAAVGGG